MIKLIKQKNGTGKMKQRTTHDYECNNFTYKAYSNNKDSAMKTKLIFAFLIISALSAPLYSQSGWSEPVRVSGIGRYSESAITTDNNGVLSAFWVKDIKLDVGYYSTVYFSQSFNGGSTWTAEQNITPDYNEVPVWEIRAVTDSKDNVHIIYAKGLESKVLVYKKYDGLTWTDDHVINISLNTLMRFGIDQLDRLFATWALNSTTYYMFCETDVVPVIWSIPKVIHKDLNFIAGDFCFGKNNDVYTLLQSNNDVDTLSQPFICKYEWNGDIWYDFKQVYNYDSANTSCAIALDYMDTLHVNTSVGSFNNSNNDLNLKKFITDSSWTNPIAVGSKNNWWERKMFVDKNSIVHIFEKNEENKILSLNHTYGKGNIWQTETIHTDPDYYIFWFDVKRKVYEEYDEYYVTYCKSRIVDGNFYNRINYQTKRISTGIEDDSENITQTTILFQNYPNPFNNSTDISYSIPQTANVKLSLYNIKGELVRDLINARLSKGQHSVMFEANDLNSGIYFYRLVVNGIETENRKMLYLK